MSEPNAKRHAGKIKSWFPAGYGFIDFCGNRLWYDGPPIPVGTAVTFAREVRRGKLMAVDVRIAK